MSLDDNNDLLMAKADILSLAVPFTESELKHAFRVKAQQTHPDLGGNAEAFKRVFEAYEFLSEFCSESITQNHLNILETLQGDFLTDLGKGLGELVNSVDCDRCQGKGYTVNVHYEYQFIRLCPSCRGLGFHWGSSRGTLLCKVCHGSGGVLYGVKEVNRYHTCSGCGGTGQIKILNPALPKGRVTSKDKQRPMRVKKNYCKCGAKLKDESCWRCTTR